MEYNKVANIKGTTTKKHQVQKMNVSNSVTSSKKIIIDLLTKFKVWNIQRPAFKIS